MAPFIANFCPFSRSQIIGQHKQEVTDIQDIIFAMEQENQEQENEMKQEFQSYRDEIKNKVRFNDTVKIFPYDSTLVFTTLVHDLLESIPNFHLQSWFIQ